jgi:tRNA (mo5U34)-methyltransferase
MSAAVPPPSGQVTQVGTLRERVAGVSWHQSLRLPDGTVTPGNFDTLDEVRRIPFPGSLAGKRCLDVGTADGFWAFEMERRGAAEVVAIDVREPSRLDWPGTPDPGELAAYQRQFAGPRGFDVAHEAYRSHVQWRDLSVYELEPGALGEFDFVFAGSLLLHLRDPVAALGAIRGVLSANGELLSVDALSPLLTLLHPAQPIARFEAPGWPMWWAMNLRCYRGLFPAAGLAVVQAGRPFWLRRGPAYTSSPRSPRPLYQRIRPALARLGILHAWVRARLP